MNLTFSPSIGPFCTTVISDSNGKTVGHIRKVRTGGVMLTSLVNSPWLSTMPGIKAKTNAKWVATRAKAKKIAEAVLHLG